MPSRTFTVDELDEMEAPWSDVYRRGMGARRWSETFSVVFRADDEKLYHLHVEQGLTEYQEYTGAERYPDADYVGSEWVVECPEVELYEEMVPKTKFRKVSDD